MVRSADEAALHHRIRHAVFVEEQAIFAATDVDAHDAEPSTLKVLAHYRGIAAGAVRLFPLDAEGTRWQGDRLAVLGDYRTRHLGGPLVRFATRSAADRGGREMQALVQVPNVAFFERLGWRRAGPVEPYVGRSHQRMVIDLVP